MIGERCVVGRVLSEVLDEDRRGALDGRRRQGSLGDRDGVAGAQLRHPAIVIVAVGCQHPELAALEVDPADGRENGIELLRNRSHRLGQDRLQIRRIQ